MICRTLLTLTATLVLFPSLGRAQWMPNGVPLCNAADTQFNPKIVSDGAGGAIVTWYDTRSGGKTDIYAQRVNAAGTVLWTLDGVAICTASGDQNEPTVVSDGAGGAIVTWEDRRSNANSDIYAQRVNSSGSVQWTTDGVVICNAVYDQRYPTIVSDGAGGAIVTWEDRRSNANSDIYAQRVNAAGAIVWATQGTALCTAAYDQAGPVIVADGAGGAIVTWVDARSDVVNDIYSQRINASGVIQWTLDGVAICTAPSYQNEIMTVADGANGAIVTWRDYRSGTTYDIYAQRINATGSVQWTANGTTVCNAANHQDDPTIASDNVGGAIVSWRDFRSGSYTDIYAQRINGSGSVQWTANGVGLCNAVGYQYNRAIIPDGVGGAIVAWEDRRSGIWHIYGQRINTSGTVQWAANGVALCTAGCCQFVPVLISDGAGGAIVTWSDGRNGYADIYALRVDQGGLVPTGVRDTPSATAVALTFNHPNPFSAGTTIDLNLSVDADVAVDVFDVSGRRVRQLNFGHMSAGPRPISFDGLDDTGNLLASGVYFYRVRAAGQMMTRKMVIAR